MPDNGINWYSLFVADMASDKYQKWLQQAHENRQLSDLSLKPLERNDGLIPKDREWIKSTSIRRIIRHIKARISMNPYNPRAEPYEGAVVEEEVTKICDCLWKHERRSSRGPKNLNLDEEINDWIDESLDTGMGYLDLRIDAMLRNPEFFNGLAIYESLDPVNVVLDSRARRIKDIRHVHIVSLYTPEDYELTFNEEAPRNTARLLHPAFQDQNEVINDMIAVVETQYIVKEKDQLLLIPREIQDKYFLDLKEPGLMFKTDFKVYLDTLKNKMSNFDIPPISKITKNMKSGEQLRWGAYSTYNTGNHEINDGKKYYLGQKFTIYPLCFLRISQNSPYGWGAGYFLKDNQKMEILINTKLAELALKSNKARVFTKGALHQDTKDAISDPLVDVVELKEFAGDITPISELLHMESSLDAIPLLINVKAMLHDYLNEEYATRRGTEGSSPFAGASGKLVNTLLMTGAVMMGELRDNLERNLSKVYQQVRNLAAYITPAKTLITIAAENNENCMKLILSGKFYDRIHSLNTMVRLDMTTPEEKMFLKQLFFKLYESGQIDPVTFLELIEYPEPKMLGNRIDDYRKKTDEALMYGSMITQNPVLRASYLPQIQESIKTLQQINEKQKMASNTRMG